MEKFYKLFLLLTLSLSCASLSADELPALRVEGRHVVDATGREVTLHGVMDTPNRYFNNWRWQTWKATYDDTDVQPCLDYFEKIFTGLTDRSQGAYCKVFRLHLDPCWTNDPNIKSDGKESGEADISCFSETRLKRYLTSLYIPLIKKALAHGLYVVVRPPGVCPQNITVGDNYNKYLITVWREFASRDFIRQHAGQVSIELANEPVNVYPSGGSLTSALHDFFQPMVDTIRQAGFTGIIWVPGSGWQSHYEDYTFYPISDDNYGYAVHCYPGWYSSGSNDNDYTDAATMAQAFTNQVPVVKTKPVIVTEIDWSPYKPGTSHKDEHGNTVLSNYGTWGTGTTSHFGMAFKRIHDFYGNVGMVIEGSGLYFDIDEYLKTGTVQPAFKGVDEACGEACFKWYKEWWNNEQPDTATSKADTTREKPADTEVEDYTLSWQDKFVYDLWAEDAIKASISPTFENGLVARNDSVREYNYSYQYQAAGNLGLKAGTEYIMRLVMSANAAGRLHVAIGEWGNQAEADIDFTPGEREYVVRFTATADGGFLLCQSGDFVGTTAIKSIKFSHVEKPFDGNMFLRYTSTAHANAWDSQACYDIPSPLEKGASYTLTLKVRASADYDDLGFWPIWNASPNRNQWGGSNDVQYEEAKTVTTEWQTVTWHFTAQFPLDRLQFCFGMLGGTIDFDDLVLTKDGDDSNLVTNGSFTTSSTKGWSNNWNGPSFQIVKDSSATGIGSIRKTVGKPQPAYNLTGQLVDDDYKGVVIIGGKKLIRR